MKRLAYSMWLYIIFFLAMTLISCKDDTVRDKGDVVTTSWHFRRSLSSVNLPTDGKTVLVGADDGTLYIMSDETVLHVMVEKRAPIMKAADIGIIDGCHRYMVSTAFHGLQLITLNDSCQIVSRVVAVMDDGRWPRKGSHYTVYDWAKGGDGFLYLGTSNGLWKVNLNDLYQTRMGIISLTRVGNSGINSISYVVNSVEWFQNQLWFTSEDGLWKLTNSKPELVSDKKEAYEGLVQNCNRLTATSRHKVITILSNKVVSYVDNSAAQIQIQIPVGEGRAFGFKRGQLVVDDRQAYDLHLTKYNKNAFGIGGSDGRMHGIYMIDGNDLKHISINFATKVDYVSVLNICEDISDNSAYAVDAGLRLYHIKDTTVQKKGQITGMPAYVRSMVVKGKSLYVATHHNVYRIPLNHSLLSRRLKAEQLDMFSIQKGKTADETIEQIYTYSETNDIFIATTSHLWRFATDEPIGKGNPIRFHVRAYSEMDRRLHDLDSIYESCDMQALSEYPNSASRDFFVGTRGYSLLSFSRSALSTLVPAEWLGRRVMSLRNITALDVEPGDKSTRIKLLIATPDTIHLVSFHSNAHNSISSVPLSVKRIAFMNHGREAIAISSQGGCFFLRINGDSLAGANLMFGHLSLYPQMARINTDKILVNSNSGAFLINGKTKQIMPINLSPKPNKLWLWVLIVTLAVVAVLLSITAYLLIHRNMRINRNMERWLQISHEHGDHFFDEPVNRIRQDMHHLRNVDKEYYTLLDKFESYSVKLRNEEAILDLCALLPENERPHIPDINVVVEILSKSLRAMQMELSWLQRAIFAYRFLVGNEKKIGKGDGHIWHQIANESVDGRPFFNEGVRREMLAIVESHHYCDYNQCILQDSIHVENVDVSVMQMPELLETIDEDFIISHQKEITKSFKAWYAEGGREKAIRYFIDEKRTVEQDLAGIYLRIVKYPRQKGATPPMFVDYFKNLLTYLYYQLFVIDNRHVLGYDERRKEYVPLFDFQQLIVMLETFSVCDDGNATELDLRPSTLIDKLLLQPEGKDSTENPISKFKDRTKSLHQAFHKQTSWREFPQFVSLVFEAYPSLEMLYGVAPRRRER